MEVMQLLDAPGQIEGETVATALTGQSGPARSPTALVMNWTREFQLIAFGEAEFSSQEPTPTCPSHDVIHLILAANGGTVPWGPLGDEAMMKIAEYNTVLVEGLLTHTFGALKRSGLQVLPALTASEHRAVFFAEVNFAPFPIPREDAFYRFARDIDADALARFSPYFFRQRLAEVRDPEYRSKQWTLNGDAMTPPRTNGPTEEKYVDAVRFLITKLKTADLAVIRQGREHANLPAAYD